MTVLSRNGAAISVYPTALAVSTGDSFDIDFEFGNNPTYIKSFIRTLAGEIIELSLYSDYDVSISENPGYNNSWGTLTLKNDYQNCSAICIYRQIENSQDVAFSSQTIFADTTEEALDKLTMLVQDEDYGARAITAPKDDLLNPADMELPNREIRANSVIVFNDTGNVSTRPIAEAFVDVVDNLDSTDPDKALSANMGHELNSTLTSIATDVSDLDIKVEEIETKTTAIESSISALEDKTDATNTKVSELETKTDATNTKVSELETKIISIDEHVAEQVGELEIKTDLTNERVDALETKTDATNERVAILEPQIEALNNEISPIKESITAIQSEISGIKKQIEAFDTRISAVENSLTLKQDIISAGVGINITDGKIINVDIATKDKVGIVKPGKNLDIEADGTINVNLAPSYTVSEIQTAIDTSTYSNVAYKCLTAGDKVLIFIYSSSNLIDSYRGINFENIKASSSFACNNLDSVSAFGKYMIWQDTNNHIWREDLSNTNRRDLNAIIKSLAPAEINVYDVRRGFQVEGGLYVIILDSNSQNYKLFFYDDSFSQTGIEVINNLGSSDPSTRFYYSEEEKVLYFWWITVTNKYLTLISQANPNSPQVLKTYDSTTFNINPSSFTFNYVFSYKQGILSDETNGYLATLTDFFDFTELKINNTPASGLYIDNGEIIALDSLNALIGINTSATESLTTLPLKNTGGTASSFHAVKFNNEIYIINFLLGSSTSRIEYRKIIKQ